MRKKIVAGNWKMNCNREEALGLITEIAGMAGDEKNNDSVVIVAPPFVHLASVYHIASQAGIYVAAQNCSSKTSGAFTGEISAAMISSVGAKYVIIGHSERRLYFNESYAELADKVKIALDNKLTPIFCIGESLEERESGIHFSVIENQIRESLFESSADNFSKLIIAYEPVWAIGTGKTASPAQAQEMHAHIRSIIGFKYGTEIASSTSILYGGSCNENNAAELFSLADVDGGLIGGASLKSRSFMKIINSF